MGVQQSAVKYISCRQRLQVIELKMKTLMVLLLLCLVGMINAECPIDLEYVTQISWNTDDCRSIQSEQELGICQTTLTSVFGVGLAQYLRDKSMFELPDYTSAAACLTTFQQKLTSLGLPSNLVLLTLNNTSDFVSNPSLCAGIQTKQDWIDKMQETSLDTACKGDLSLATACSTCHSSGEVAQAKLTAGIENITDETSLKCYYFVCMYAAGVVNEFGPKNIYTAACILRVPFLHKNASSHSRIWVYTSIGAVAGILLLCCAVLCYYWWVRRNGVGPAKHKRFVRMSKSLLKATVRPNTGAVWFDMEEIKAATANFSGENVIGQGGFGTVYKGVLSDGQQIAVKRITNCTSEGDSEFINEAEIINSIRHRNLVVLRGFSVSSDDTEGRQRFLVYDYMANGSLDGHIFGERGKNKGALNWEQRKNIAIGTAEGLCYLHFGVQPAIYHRDIKATNILLDDQMNACVADFGLARMTIEGQSHLTTRIAGTQGYLAPEYALYGQLSDRNDVYSFGVVLLEIMSGRKALDNCVELPSDYLITDWAWRLVKSGRTLDVVDRRIRESGPQKIMERFVLVGILCAHVMVAFRPSIAEALKMLKGDTNIPEIRDRPAPLTHVESFSHEYDSFRSNFNLLSIQLSR